MKIGIVILPNERLVRPSLLTYSIAKALKSFSKKDNEIYLILLEKTSEIQGISNTKDISNALLNNLTKFNVNFNNIYVVYDSDIDSSNFVTLLIQFFSKLNKMERKQIFNYLKQDNKMFTHIFSYLMIQPIYLDKLIMTKDKNEFYQLIKKKMISLPQPEFIEQVFDFKGDILFNDPIRDIYFNDSESILTSKIKKYKNPISISSMLNLFDLNSYKNRSLDEKKEILLNKIITFGKNFKSNLGKNVKMYLNNKEKIVNIMKLLSKEKINSLFKEIIKSPMCIADAARFTGYSYVTMHKIFSELNKRGILKSEITSDKRKTVYSLAINIIDMQFSIC